MMRKADGSPGAAVQVGVVTGLWRYPVKSMAAEALSAATLSWAGLAGDRRWAFIRAGSGENGFPWHTIRENPAMSCYVPRLLQPERPDKSEVVVRTPSGRTYDLADPALADELGTGLRLMRLDRGTFDAMPVSLIGTATVSALCGAAGVADNELRFRPNIVISTVSGAPFAEDEWVGCTVWLGQAAVRVDRRDSRCVVVNVDPEAGYPDGPVLKVAGELGGACAGVYGSTVRPGEIQVGDLVTIGEARLGALIWRIRRRWPEIGEGRDRRGRGGHHRSFGIRGTGLADGGQQRRQDDGPGGAALTSEEWIWSCAADAWSTLNPAWTRCGTWRSRRAGWPGSGPGCLPPRPSSTSGA